VRVDERSQQARMVARWPDEKLIDIGIPIRSYGPQNKPGFGMVDEHACIIMSMFDIDITRFE
jgi:hypothetical protein